MLISTQITAFTAGNPVVGYGNFFAVNPNICLHFRMQIDIMVTHIIPLYSHMPEIRDSLTCGVDLHNADTRKGAESERAAVDVPRFASFARMETVAKAGQRRTKKFGPKLPLPEIRVVDRESATKSAHVCASDPMKSRFLA